MNSSHSIYRFLSNIVIAVAVAGISGCGFLVVHTVRHIYSEATKDERLVDDALLNYQRMIVSGKYDHLAEVFDASAVISDDDQAPVVGRKAIGAFLQSSTDYKIVEYELKATSIVVSGDKASQSGTYRQVLSLVNENRKTVTGTFDIEWLRQSGGAWLIHRMHTASI